MKRILLLLLTLLTTACVPLPDAIELPPQATAASGSSEDPIVPVFSPVPEQPVTITAVPTAAAIEYAAYQNDTPASPLLKDITVKELDWANLAAGRQYKTRFCRETVDFQQFRFFAESFRTGADGTTFTIRVRFPQSWTDLQCLSMNQYLGFRFCLDGKAQHDFRLTDQSVILSEALCSARCDDFTMTYTSETITDEVVHAYHEWTIVPFFWHWKNFSGNKYNNNNNRTWIDITGDDFCEYSGTEDAYLGGEIEITELYDLSLTLPIEHIYEPAEPVKEPRFVQVSVWAEDVARNEKEGHYGPDGRLKDGSYVVYGTWQNVTVDVSQLQFHIERLYYWEHGFFCLMHIVYPESWSEEVRRNARIGIQVYADGEPFGEAIDSKGPMRSYFKSAGSNWRNTGNPNSNAPYPTETYRFYDQHRFSLADPIGSKELTFKVTLEYFTGMTNESGRTVDLTNGEPYDVDSAGSDIVAMPSETIVLAEYTIPTDQLTFAQGGSK